MSDKDQSKQTEQPEQKPVIYVIIEGIVSKAETIAKLPKYGDES